MPVNRNALIRYKTIDKCLRNRLRKWTLETLIEAVSEAMYESEGQDRDVSRRTIQADIQTMRSNKLGYNAPIVVVDKKYYTYDDPEYCITNIPLTDEDLARMSEAVEILKQFKGFSHFSNLNEVVQKLEHHVYTAQHHTQPIIHFERNDLLRGLEHLDVIYKAITDHKAINIVYQSFKAREEKAFVFHAWWLKEFKNRWFAVGVKTDENPPHILNLALDRMLSVSPNNEARYINNETIDQERFYLHAIGVTVSANVRPRNIRIWINRLHAPYVITKPLHHSQEILDTHIDGSITINLKVVHNFELEKEILSFGEGFRVIAPASLARKMNERLAMAVAQYEGATHAPPSSQLPNEPDPPIPAT